MPKLSKKMKEIVTENMRRSILEISEEIIIREGLDSLTMEKLAREAEVSAGSIYNYFKNKEEIVDSIMENSFQRLLLTLAEIAGKTLSATDKLLATATFMFEDFIRVRSLHESIMHRHPPITREKMRQGHRHLVGLIAGIIKQGMDEGDFAEQDVNIAASAFLGISRELQLDPGEIFTDIPPQTMAETAVSIYMSGIRSGAKK